MYDWNLRLSKRVDIWTILFLWVMTILYTIANYVIYSTASAYDLYNGDSSAIVEALKAFLYSGAIALPTTIMMLGDRKFVSKQVRNNELMKETTLQETNHKKRNVIRIILLGVITFFSLPWIFSMVGIYISDIPGLNLIFLGAQPYNGHPSVHLGRHHGTTAYLFAVYAIILSVSLDSQYNLKNKFSRSVIAGLIAFLSMYAFIAGLEDGLNEQLLKRGIEPFLLPFLAEAYGGTVSWIIVAIISVVFLLLWFIISLKKKRNDV
jgi:hypothetical protein